MFTKKKNKPTVTPPVAEVNPDLENERKKCTFNVKELTYFLDGGEEKYKERRNKEEFYLSDPELMSDKNGVPSELLSHEDQYREAVRKSCVLLRKQRKYTPRSDASSLDLNANRSSIGIRIGAAIFKDGNPFSLHNIMFIPVIMQQGTEEQKTYWLKRALNMEFFGTYAQTELGHGTFIRGLETTATYLPDKKQFELNSPTLSSYKWWPGGLGHTSNYAIVMAQLYTQGVCHGVHPFVVQIRDEKTYKPLPGVTVGEIGRKFGMNATNNGYLAFKKVLIPRLNMLMKNSQVAEDGKYTKTRRGTNKLAYGGMIFVRVVIVDDMSYWMSKVATIATRYSAVRRQSEMKPGEREPQILDYQTQQMKLFPYIAYAYVFKFASVHLWELYNSAMGSQGNLDSLPELHAMACCLKAVCTSDGLQAVETMRLACGGHGYMVASNLPSSYALVAAACTYEGENTVMLLQTARALVKAYVRAKTGERLVGTMAYLSESQDASYPWNNTLNDLVRGFKQIAGAKVSRCAELLREAEAAGSPPEVAWNSVSQQLVEAAEAHGRAFLVQTYTEAAHGKTCAGLSLELREIMGQLCELYCVFWALRRAGDLILYAGMRGTDDIRVLEAWQRRLLAALRPNAVGLVDAFDFHDSILGSALGAWDGRVYERLLESAMQSPLNKRPVHDSFHASIQPLLTAKY